MIPKLIISNSERDSNMFYATGILIPDDFVCLEKNGRKTIYIDDLEYNRAKKEAEVNKVVNYSEYAKGVDRNTFGKILINILKENKIKKVFVPENFQMKYADILLKNKIRIEIKPEPFFGKRIIKNNNEIDKIKETQRINEKAIGEAIRIIKRSKIRKDQKLSYQNKILTSEFIQFVIDTELLKGKCQSEFNIVSCGKDSADPHQKGEGPLIAHQPIVIDVFPQSKTNRYFADTTRTVVRGKASLEIKKIYQAVLEAQKLGISRIKPEIKGSVVHKLVQDYFEKHNFKTEEKNGKVQGFIHGTGHGVGLDIHELPNLNANSKDILKAGNIVTVEPGLYYPKIGGVRTEDLILVTKNGYENLTKLPKVLEV